MLDQFPDKVKLVFKNYPLDYNPFAFKSAAAALAADKQNRFWEYHGLLFLNAASIDDQKIKQLAAQLGLNMETFVADMQSADIHGLIQRDLDEAAEAGVTALPAVFVNGKRLEDLSLEAIQQVIENEID